MVKKSIDAKVRPLANPSLEKASLFGAARLYVSKDSLIALTNGLESNRPCVVEKLIDGAVPRPIAPAQVADDAAPSADQPICREASLCVPPEKNLSPNVVMMTRAFQDATGFRVGDQVRITLIESTPDIDEVVVRDVTEAAEANLSPRYPLDWRSILSTSMDRAEQIFAGMMLDVGLINKGPRRNFKVIRVNGHSHKLGRFNLTTSTIRILGADERDDSAAAGGTPRAELVLTGVPGLTDQVAYINKFLRAFGRRFLFRRECSSCAMVIHGVHGTGKTFILKQLAATGWGSVFWIKPSHKLPIVREKFKEAFKMQPSMILLDDLGKLIAKDPSGAMIEMLQEELDALSAKALTEGRLPNVVVVVTCADYVLDVPIELRQSSRLPLDCMLPVPRASERRKILEFFYPQLRDAEREACLDSIASKTHAYTGGDLERLVFNANSFLRARVESEQAVAVASQQRADGQVEGEATVEEQQQHFLLPSDLEQALRITRPAIMDGINLNPPTIYWHDIGGQDPFKELLSSLIEDTKNPDPEMHEYVCSQPKGVLLYGPPGCSKTLSAQAMATESSLNFFAVKGAELLNMYVGESERAVRTLFQRARVAAPSIIFFDEIDSIGGQRDSGDGPSRSQGSVNILTALLTEMDGFESLDGVLIMAATNRPDAMDPALLRPGRFDEIIYVGPPDEQAREQVFAVHLRGRGLADDVDFATLARQADGYSGAEIEAICKKAGAAALKRRKVQRRQDSAATPATKVKITMEDLRDAMEQTTRNITPSMIDSYETWARQFKRG